MTSLNFGAILDDGDVEDAVMDTLKAGVSIYLTEVERQKDLTPGYYARPRSYVFRNDFDKWPEEHLPCVLVLSTGLLGTPSREGSGIVRAQFGIGVAVIVSAGNQTNSRRMAYRYASTVRKLLEDQQSLQGALDGNVRGVDWLDSQSSELPSDADRTIFASRQVFAVDIRNVLTRGLGPKVLDPPKDSSGNDDPLGEYDPWPTVPDRAHVVTTYSKEGIVPDEEGGS